MRRFWWLVAAAGGAMVLASSANAAGPVDDVPDGEPSSDDDVPSDVPAGIDDPRYPGLQLIDLRAQAPQQYILRDRTLDEVTMVVLHQTGFTWEPDNPLWSEVRSHFTVRRDGRVQISFDPEKRLRYGSNKANRWCITIEHEGSYPNSNGNCWKPEKFGCHNLADAPNLVSSARQLLRDLRDLCPNLTQVYAHRQWENDKQNCCGPDVWRAVGQWAVDELGLSDGGPGWHSEDGLSIPGSWRGEFA